MSLGTFCRSTIKLIERPGLRYRWKKLSKGTDPRVALNLAQKLEQLNYKDPELAFRVNIGYHAEGSDRKVKLAQRLEHRRAVKESFELQKAAKNRTLKPSLEDIEEEWKSTAGPSHVKEAAEYYGVYEDLFEDAYFAPLTALKIKYAYNLDEEFLSLVHRGNVLKPYEAANAPEVTYAAQDNELFTLALTSPDVNLSGDKECLHWLVGNIPGNQISKGEVLVDYLQPFPPRGVGYCRYVFVLYKQEKRLDLSKYAREAPCLNLAARDFYTYDFYRELQDDITPTGLAFFQSDWEPTLTNFYHHVLNMKEPTFSYDFDETILKPQEWFPHREPFNIYMDKYRDRKDLQKQLLLEKLKERHPFRPPPPPPKYPLAHHISNEYASWLKDDIRRKRMREGKWKYM